MLYLFLFQLDIIYIVTNEKRKLYYVGEIIFLVIFPWYFAYKSYLFIFILQPFFICKNRKIEFLLKKTIETYKHLKATRILSNTAAEIWWHSSATRWTMRAIIFIFCFRFYFTFVFILTFVYILTFVFVLLSFKKKKQLKIYFYMMALLGHHTPANQPQGDKKCKIIRW